MFELVPFVHGNHLRTYDPFREMEDLENRFFGGTAGDWGGIRTDIQDKGDHYLMEADLPGFKKDDIHIDVNDGVMTITARTQAMESSGVAARNRMNTIFSAMDIPQTAT